MSRLHDIAQGVAPLLDGQWRYNRLAAENEKTHWQNRATLNDDTRTGRQIVFCSIWNRPERINIYGSLPERYSKTRITVGQGRDTPAIAADIERRFLPGYLTEWDEAEADKRRRAETMALYSHQVDLIRRIAPDFRQAYTQQLTGCDEFYFKGGKVRLSSSGYDAHLELSLPFDKLVRVLIFLKSR